jgi:AcrR family transcriptional regulator
MTCALRGDLTMGDVAAWAGLSRQAVYLHFGNRGALLAALLEHLEGSAEDPVAAPSARAAVAAMVARHAGSFGRLYPVASLMASFAPWQRWEDRRLDGCRLLAGRFHAEGALAPHLSVEAAADLLWTLTSLATWRDLVIGRGWSADRYRSHVTFLATGALTR